MTGRALANHFTPLDLASTLAGWLSRGPTFLLLGAWLAGDIGQTLGIFLNNCLATQKFSGIVHKKKNGRRSPKETARDTDISTGFFRSGWKDISGPRFNIAELLFVSIVAFAVWIWQDLSGSTSKPALVVSSPPTNMMSWLGWNLGMAGTAARNLLRVYRLYVIWRSKSLESIAAWSFTSLILQNVTMTISILAVSHILSSVFAQSPYILNVGLALVGDAVARSLSSTFDDLMADSLNSQVLSSSVGATAATPCHTGPTALGPTDWLYRDSAPSPSSSLFPSPPNDPGASSPSEFYQDEHRRDLHSGLVLFRPSLPSRA
ncbi:hypothetical protein JCM21900_000031 [Sporobolomyces salmonicolor]